MKHPNYKKIYSDILNAKYAEKIPYCLPILNKKNLSSTDIIRLNKIIFGTEGNLYNQKHKSYDEPAILEILNYQKIHQCNNSQLAKQFNVSRNTIAKWKKMFLV
ncbi:helix-turn-helix domain-containing protein [Chryseobacterium arthrosphaerae]|uniref:helix-turn-helix domain-containing protein n=1 Tax=Chryseobacterium arthrosphaerae TaxID=651561 RepID=UPI000F4E1772|nr:helix-turn-helix domain-containing protein [Chryseobacterium arthrosphaerae]AYZ12790.1 helix-turn-helix domain-containing protein [Chryseobacterium arthrosphaerae]